MSSLPFRQRIRASIVFVSCVLLTTHNFISNTFDLGAHATPNQSPANCFETFQSDSELSVTMMLERVSRDGYQSTHGLLRERKLDDVYTRSFGLQGKVLSRLMTATGTQPAEFAKAARVGIATASAIILAVFAVYVLNEFGLFAALTLIVLTNLTQWVVFVARNLYWVYFLEILPCFLSIMLCPREYGASRASWFRFYSWIGASVLIGSLCTEQNVTNIALGSGIGPLYYGIKNAWWAKVTAKKTFICVAVATFAVTGATLATCVQTGIYRGSLTMGFQEVFGSVLTRSYVPLDDRGAPPGISAFQIFERYLYLPMLGLPFDDPNRMRIYLSLFSVLAAIVPLVFVVAFDGAVFPSIAKARRKLLGLAGATLWAFASSLSWAFAMKGHMWHHIHMNGVIFYIPYLPFMYVFLGMAISVLFPIRWNLFWVSQPAEQSVAKTSELHKKCKPFPRNDP